MVDAGDLKSHELCSCGFESRRPHQADRRNTGVAHGMTAHPKAAASEPFLALAEAENRPPHHMPGLWFIAAKNNGLL